MRIARILLLPIVALTAAACNDNLGPTAWSDLPDTVTLYSAARTNLMGQPSGYDFTVPRAVVVESAGEVQNFDFLLTDQAGAFSLIPSGKVLGNANRAGLAPVTADSLRGIRQAPTDTMQFVTSAPVPIHAGDFFVARSRRTSCYLTTGSYYAKFEVMTLNPDSGTVKLAIARNPYCGETSLIPPGS